MLTQSNIMNYDNIIRHRSAIYTDIQGKVINLTYTHILVTIKTIYLNFVTGNNIITRTLQNNLKVPLTAQTIQYGNLFEQFVILEIIRLNDYYEKHFKFSYLATKDGVEVDLIIERPGQSIILVEIKSTAVNNSDDSKHLKHLKADFKSPQLYVFNNAKTATVIDDVKFTNWMDGIKDIFE